MLRGTLLWVEGPVWSSQVLCAEQGPEAQLFTPNISPGTSPLWSLDPSFGCPPLVSGFSLSPGQALGICHRDLLTGEI